MTVRKVHKSLMSRLHPAYKVDDSWKECKWYVGVGKYGCYSNRLIDAVYGLIKAWLDDHK